MFFFACHSVLICVGCMEHSDSESDFALFEVMTFLMIPW